MHQPRTTNSVQRLWVGYICPDLLTLDDIGAADTLRGRVIRAVFRLLRLWPPRQGAGRAPGMHRHHCAIAWWIEDRFLR